jgi:hypothetical protein
MRLAALCWWRPPCLLQTVIVNLRSTHDEALRGVLWRSRGAWLVLKEPYAIAPGRTPQPLDGDAVIHRDNVAFLQVLP